MSSLTTVRMWAVEGQKGFKSSFLRNRKSQRTKQ